MNDKKFGIIEIRDGETVRTYEGLFEIPKIKVDIVEYQGFYMPTNRAWEDIELNFFDYCDIRNLIWIDEWLIEQCDIATGLTMRAVDYKKDIIFKIGEYQWNLYGCFLRDVSDNLLKALTRRVLVERIGYPTMQISKTIVLNIDRAMLVDI